MATRRLNHAIHMAAVTQIRHKHSPVRAYFEKKIAEGKTRKGSAARSNASSAMPSTSGSRLTLPAGCPQKLTAREGNRGTALAPARPAHTPGTGSSDKPLPDQHPAYDQAPRPGEQSQRRRSRTRAERLDNKEVFDLVGVPGLTVRCQDGAELAFWQACGCSLVLTMRVATDKAVGSAV